MSRERLVHDVGKYVARTARNLPEGEVPRVLLEMLCRDLYGREGEPRASERFGELATESLDQRDLLDACFAEIDALESRVRSADPDAIRRAAELALEIERRLRAEAQR